MCMLQESMAGDVKDVATAEQPVVKAATQQAPDQALTAEHGDAIEEFLAGLAGPAPGPAPSTPRTPGSPGGGELPKLAPVPPMLRLG